MTTPVSVIIPCHDVAACVGAQVRAVLPQLAPEDELVLVDNRSTDGTPAVLAALAREDARIRVATAPERAGANHARNVGIAAARHELLLFCDADDTVRPGWVEAFRAVLPLAGIAGGTATPVDATGDRLGPDLGLHSVFGGPDYPLGACMGVSRPVLDAVGGFDESFAGGHDETDLAWRAAAAGWPTRLAAGAHISYLQRPSAASVARQRRNYARTAVQLWTRHPGVVDPHGVSLRGAVRGVLRHLPAGLRAARGTATLAQASAWGWNVGLLEGHLRYRVLGRPPQPEIAVLDGRPST